MAIRTMFALSIALLSSAAAFAQQAPELSEQQRASYAIGMAQARTLEKLAIKVDPKMASAGFSDVLTGNKPRLTDSEAREVLASLQKDEAGRQSPTQQQASARQQSGAQKMIAAKNKAAGQALRDANKTKPGVITLDSGLQYRIIQTGFGKKPTLDDTVSVNYRGRSADGKEFGSTYKSGQPVSFAVKKVIPGWREALPLMQVGSKWELVVPAELAYGERMPSRNIGPNSTLIFELELLAVSDNDSAIGKENPKP
ncbi:FKBP-type peptidyl-prolyl cis-trans isomerase [Variovorax paradoxus]|nr:FKBP-type peptidyl-prolyl cis-trans isomerase [Variovorax paradoxus]MBT2303261.1 FKBP-type peptidyl-prolyl cis-trans isomerase [Variovorax paradoxus]